MQISTYIPRAHVLTDVPAEDRDSVLRYVVDRMVELELVAEKSSKTVLKSILEREAVGSTGIGRGIAIPHAKTRVVDKPCVVFARLDGTVDFGATDGARVHSVFVVVSPPKAVDEHVAIVRWVAKLARSDYYATILSNTTDGDSLCSLFSEIDHGS